MTLAVIVDAMAGEYFACGIVVGYDSADSLVAFGHNYLVLVAWRQR